MIVLNVWKFSTVCWLQRHFGHVRPPPPPFSLLKNPWPSNILTFFCFCFYMHKTCFFFKKAFIHWYKKRKHATRIRQLVPLMHKWCVEWNYAHDDARNLREFFWCWYANTDILRMKKPPDEKFNMLPKQSSKLITLL